MKIEGDIPVSLSVRNGARFLFISKDQSHLTHGLHKYPAKFFPELPRWAIQRFSQEGSSVLDPFMGSGTVNVEAMLLNRHGIGMDVDPFSRLLSRVKTTPLPVFQLQQAWNTLSEQVMSSQHLDHVNGVPSFPYRDQWFKPYVLKELAWIQSQITHLHTSPAITDFFRVCFSSIIRQVSEADNHCTRTVIRKKLNKRVQPGQALQLFLLRTSRNVERMTEFSQRVGTGTCTIPSKGDARAMPMLDSASIDLAVTSPPYANAVDYPRTHQLELYWLGLASGSLQPLKRLHVGTEAVCAKDYTIPHKTGCRAADRVISRIYHQDPRRAYIATKYLWDMRANLIEVYRVLKPGGVYVMVVGNNVMRGEVLETWRYLCEEAERVGFTIECRFISAIIKHFIKVPRKERITDDHVLILRK